MFRALILFCLMGCSLAKAVPTSTNLSNPPLTVAIETNEVATNQFYVGTVTTTIKDGVTAIFYVVAGTIAILSYLQARKTLFAPIRTETYKLQLKALEDVLFFFEKHSALHIDGEFDFEKIVRLNAGKMFDDYVFTFFEKNITDKEAFAKRREEAYKDLIGMSVPQKYFESHFELNDAHVTNAQQPPELPSNPALILAKWQSYEYGMIGFTTKHQQAMTKLQKFQVSPLLPNDLKTLISDFEQQVHKNLMVVGEVLTTLSKQLPEKYPNTDTLKKANLSWVWNEYNDKYSRLEGKQKEILNYLGEYFQIENLLVKNAHR